MIIIIRLKIEQFDGAAIHRIRTKRFMVMAAKEGR